MNGLTTEFMVLYNDFCVVIFSAGLPSVKAVP